MRPKKGLVAVQFIGSDRVEVVPKWQAEVYEKYGVAMPLETYGQ